MSDRACSWSWYSDPTSIDIGVIKSVRSALENGRTVLLADENQYVALEHSSEGQCRANRNGSAINATAVDASTLALWQTVRSDGAVYLTKFVNYQHKTLFTGNRVLIVPLYMDWKACVPTRLKRNVDTSTTAVSKKIVLGAKAIAWTSLAVVIRKHPIFANVVMGISVLYTLQMFDVTPGDVLILTANSAGALVLDVLGLKEWWGNRESTYMFCWKILGLVVVFLLTSQMYKYFPSSGKLRMKMQIPMTMVQESEDSDTSAGMGMNVRDCETKIVATPEPASSEWPDSPEIIVNETCTWPKENCVSRARSPGDVHLEIVSELPEMHLSSTNLGGETSSSREAAFRPSDRKQENSRMVPVFDGAEMEGEDAVELKPTIWNPSLLRTLPTSISSERVMVPEEVAVGKIEYAAVKGPRKWENLTSDTVEDLHSGIRNGTGLVGGKDKYPTLSGPCAMSDCSLEREGEDRVKYISTKVTAASEVNIVAPRTNTGVEGDSMSGLKGSDGPVPESVSANVGDEAEGVIDKTDGENRDETKNADNISEVEKECTPQHNNKTLLSDGDKVDKLGDGDLGDQECQASQITLCDTGKTFGGKHCSKKVKEVSKILIEDRILTDSGLLPIPEFNKPWEANFCGLHSNKYADRIKDLVCTLEECFGRNFSCTYEGRTFRYCHLHMAAALEQEMKARMQTAPETTDKRGWDEWEYEDVWNKKPVDWSRRSSGEWDDCPTKRRTVEEHQAQESMDWEPSSKRRTSIDKTAEVVHNDNDEAAAGSTMHAGGFEYQSRPWNDIGNRTKADAPAFMSSRQSVHGPDSAFKHFAQSGLEEDTVRSAEIESLMPNFVRRPREKPTFIPVDMQIDYETGGTKKKDPWDIVAEGIGELRGGSDEKDVKSTNKITEFVVFALRGFGCFKVELGIGAYGKELCETLKRQATVMKEAMYRKGIRVPLTNRIVSGMAEAAWGSEVPGGVPENHLLARDFVPWDLGSFEDYVRKDDKFEARSRPPAAMNVITRAIKQQIKLFGAVYGEEHISERMEALSFLEELHESYEEFFSPIFLMAVWDEMVFEYTMVVTEGIRRLLQSLPKSARRDKLKERALTPKPDGTTIWKFPVTFKMTNGLGFWKSRIVPRLERKVEREMLQSAIPYAPGKRAAGREEDEDEGVEKGQDCATANSFRSMYPAGRKLTMQENRDSTPLAPQINGKVLCWDFSSWGGCPNGKDCPRLHQTMKLQGLHWLILAQLARRGGHVSRARIPVEAIDGYVQALRESHGKNETNGGKTTWQPKSQTTASGQERALNPCIGAPPGEFVDIELTELERELEEVLYATDDWIFPSDTASVDWTRSETLSLEQMEIQDWWDSSALPVHGLLETHILNDLLTVGKPFTVKTVEDTLHKLTRNGSDKERRLAEQALIDFKEMRAGKQQVDGVLWGIRREWGEFVSQDMHVGNLHFQVIDFGEDLLLDTTTQKLLGASSRKETNQCIILHLGAALAWHSRGRKKSIPSRGVIYQQAMVTRQEEAAHAKEAGEAVKVPRSAEEQVISSHAHDALNSNHDRDFRGIFFFLKNLWGEIAPLVDLRVFDIGRGCQQHEVTVHLFRHSKDEPNDGFLDLVAFRHHMRWAKPCQDTPLTKWRDWKDDFRRIIVYPISDWKNHLKRFTSPSDTLSWYMCTACKRKTKVPADAWVYGAIEPDGNDIDADPLSWIEPNHRNGVSDQATPDHNASGALWYQTVPLTERTGALCEIQLSEEEKKRLPPPRIGYLGPTGDLRSR